MGGKSNNEKVRRMLLAIGEKAVWKHFNVKGTNRKGTIHKMVGFIKTALYPVIVSE